MPDKEMSQAERIVAHNEALVKAMNRAVRPLRQDGYTNLLNRYGTSKDIQENYKFQREPMVPDNVLTDFYEGNGLFAKVIDAPAEEAVKHGFTLKDVSDSKIEDFYVEALDELDWEEKAMTAIKWSRLFGGSIAVMLVNDGRGLEEPLDWENIKSIDDIRIFDRSLVQPEEITRYKYDPKGEPFSTRGSRLGFPEHYYVTSKHGNFTVHDSRCLVFQNGVLPENTTNSNYEMWGMPEYVRIHRAIRDAEVAHSSAPKMMERSVQPVYKMKDLANLLATDEGEDKVLKRMELIDMARGMLNSLIIDSEGEDYDFKSFTFTGINDVLGASCSMLSAITNIPQTILFGTTIGGLSTTDDTSMENYYNFIERIQKKMLRSNLRYLLSVIFQAGLHSGEIDEVPPIKVEFNPLWSLSDSEQRDIDLKDAQIALTKAQTTQVYVDMQAIYPSEVRKKLADSDEFIVEQILDEVEDDVSLEDIIMSTEEEMNGAQYGTEESVEEHKVDEPNNGRAPIAAPNATRLPEDMDVDAQIENADAQAENDVKPGGVGIVVVKDGMILCGTRHNDTGYGLICGPGGHIDEGETPEQAAMRETEEEFGIKPKNLVFIGHGPLEPETGFAPYIYFCDEFEGEPSCDDLEMVAPKFRTLEELKDLDASLYPAFKDGVILFINQLGIDSHNDEADTHDDGGAGSGNHGHEGVKGQVGGSAPAGSDPVPMKGVSDNTASLVKKRKENLHGFGMSGDEKAEARKELVSSLEKDGAKVSYNEEYDSYSVFAPNCSLQECRDMECALNFSNFAKTSESEYIAKCREENVDPLLHSDKNEVPQNFLKNSDGTQVYQNLNSRSVLTNDEIIEYSSTDKDLNPKGNKAFEDSTNNAIESMSPEERNAVTDYTSQYGVNYSRVNNYLNGTNPDDAMAKANAELLDKALDHEIGAPVTVYRGEQDLSHIDPKLNAALRKVEKGDYSQAEKIKKGLEGKEVEVPVVCSTSIGGSVQGFNQLPVQFIFKAPADAKGVNITELSKYGGSKDTLSSMFGSGSYESEIAFKPGMKYKIDRVDFNLTTTGKKRNGQIFITATVLTDSSRNDGGPGSGNFNHEGIPGQVGGSVGKMEKLAQGYDDPKSFVKANVKTLKENGISTMKAATECWKDGMYAKDIEYKDIGKENAVDIIKENIPANISHGWFVEADSSYKGKIENIALTNDDVRNAGLNIAYDNYKVFSGKDISYEEFLNSDIKVYRGKNSEKFVEGDDVLSFTYDRKVAEKFGSNVLEETIKPIQTIGSYQTTGEHEILVRRKQTNAKEFGNDSVDDEKNSYTDTNILPETIDKYANSATIKSKDITEDGGPGSGRYPKGSGNSKFSESTYKKTIIGTKTVDGKKVKSIHPHAMKRMTSRNIYPNNVKAALKKGKASKGNVDGRTEYLFNGTKAIIQDNNGMLLTAIYVGKRK